VTERTGIATMGGAPVTLVGDEIKVGDKAPDFTALNVDLKERTLSDFKGKVVVLSAVPSLDTPVCSLETARFSAEADRLGDNVRILTISMDLPFAQKRWCAAEGGANVVTLSDHRDADFGNKYGVLMKGFRLLARAIFVTDKEGVIRYIQVVPEITTEPDYDAVIKAVKELL
jgi:thiol peroxidase